MTVEARLRWLGRSRAPVGFASRVLAAAGIGDVYAEMETPIGRFFVAWGDRGVSAVREVHYGAEAFEAWFRSLTGRPVRRAPEGARPPAGRRAEFDLDALTPFEAAVLRKTLEIPAGEVRTYSWVAREIGRPRAVRAVGTALANNPIPILIPCHRVVRSDGVIGNYGAGGPEAKKQILGAEGVQVSELERLARAGIRYIGSDTTHIYCVPTCRNARRITEVHRVGFGSSRAAESAGYRACRVCRPAEAAA